MSIQFQVILLTNVSQWREDPYLKHYGIEIEDKMTVVRRVLHLYQLKENVLYD